MERKFTPYLREGLGARPEEFARSTCFTAGHLTSVNAGWRSLRPVIDAAQCTLCLNCYMYCPDGTVFKVRDGEGVCTALAIDYDFCKGCRVFEMDLTGSDALPDDLCQAGFQLGDQVIHIFLVQKSALLGIGHDGIVLAQKGV